MSPRTRTLRRFLGTFRISSLFGISLRECGEADMRLPNQLRPTRAASSSELRHLLPLKGALDISFVYSWLCFHVTPERARFTHFCTALTSEIQQISSNILVLKNFAFCDFLVKFVVCRTDFDENLSGIHENSNVENQCV